MKLREWRLLKMYPLWKVAEMAGKKSPTTVHYWETKGIKLYKNRMLLKRISKNKIKDFRGEE